MSPKARALRAAKTRYEHAMQAKIATGGAQACGVLSTTALRALPATLASAGLCFMSTVAQGSQGARQGRESSNGLRRALQRSPNEVGPRNFLLVPTNTLRSPRNERTEPKL